MRGLMSGRRKAVEQHVSKIPLSLMAVIQNALSQAWCLLMADVVNGEFAICNEHEDVITERLYMILDSLYSCEQVAVKGFALFETPVREGNVRNRAGDRLDCQPDLTFRPLRGQISTNSHVMTAIFVECKPIDSQHPIGSTYCKTGVSRFVEGDYAWAVDRALVLGYVRNICSLPDGLSYVLEKEPAKKSYKLIKKLELIGSTSEGDVVYCSVHNRTFSMPPSSAQTAPITLHHLWLKPDEPCDKSMCRA